MLNGYFPYIGHIAVALVLSSITVLIHFGGMRSVQFYFRKFSERNTHRRFRGIIMVGTVIIIMLTHCLEVALWAGYYYVRGATPDWESSVYTSLLCYTTLGESNSPLSGTWRSLGGFEGMNSMLMFGWSTAILASVLFKLRILDEYGEK